jgi:hypothetical protein
MTHKDKYQQSLTNGKRGGPTKIPWTVKAFRTATALVVFGVPLAVGASALIGYGAYHAYKRITGRQ